MDYKIGNFPQEACLGDHISYNKGCYIGQETHARMFHRGHSNWISVCLKIPENVKTGVGEALFHNFEEIGKITSLGSFSKNGFLTGIGMIKNDFGKDEILLSLKGVNNPIIQQKSLPSKIIKNIEN